MVGLWGIAFFSPELISTAFKDRPLRLGEIRTQELLTALNSSAPAAVYIRGRLPADVRADVERGGVSPEGTSATLLAGLNQVIRSGLRSNPSPSPMCAHKATTNW